MKIEKISKNLIRHITIVIFIASLALLNFIGCGKNNEQTGLSFENITFRDVPGVTEEEIKALEALKTQYEYFTLGVVLSTESFIRENGDAGGFSALFSQWLSGVFEIPFNIEYVGVFDIIRELYNGTVHFSSDIRFTEDRRDYIFATDLITLRYMVSVRLKDSRPLEEIALTRPLRYAFIANTVSIDDVAAVVEPGSYETVLITSHNTVYPMLESGEIDAFIMLHPAEFVFDEYDDIEIQSFIPIILSPVSLTTGIRELEPVISIVNKIVESGGIFYINDLYRQGNDEYRKQRFFNMLDDDEKEFLRNNTVIPIANAYYNYPVSFYNTFVNRWEGISVDVLDEIEKLTGFSFETINATDAVFTDLLPMLEDGSAYLLPALHYTRAREGRFIWPGNSLLTDRYALISRGDFPNINLFDIPFARVGLVRGNAITEAFHSWFPDAAYTVEYASFDDSIFALDRGEIDLLMYTEFSLLSISNYYYLSDFKVNFTFNYATEITFGFNIDQAVLCSIFDKALLQIDTAGITHQWTTRTYDYRSRLLRAQRPWLIGATVLSLIVLALVLVILVRNRSTGKRMEQLVEQANAASLSKSRFLASMSHEIRTPMNAITSMAELALREDLSDKVRDHVHTIKQAGANLISIINDILDFSKVEAGILEITSGNYDLSSLVNDVVNIIRNRIAEKPIRFFTNIDSKIPNSLIGDVVRMRQIFLNLLSNAVKYTEKGYINLSITIENHNEEQVWLKISVSDTGFGIKAEDQEKLFKEFIQLDSTRNRGIEGTGLGLSITKRLCIAMGGDINMESEYGKGSTFTVLIPQGIESDTPFAAVENAQGKKVLVYEGRRTYINSLCWSLENLGISYTLAVNPEDLAEALEHREWFFVVSGYGLYDKIEAIMENVKFPEGKKPPLLTLMVGMEKEVYIPNVYFAYMPVHTLTIANIFNGNTDKLYLGNNKTHATFSFTIPRARILVVDDLGTNLKVAEGLLEPYQAKVDTCLSGREAIEMIKNYDYDLVFMDHMMPEMDGIETTAAIRAFNINVPIIALTANAVTGMREMFLEEGFNDFLAKPIDISKLEEILDRWVPKEKHNIKTGKKLVILVDENPKNLRLGINALDTQYDVITAPSAEKMYKLLENNDPALILLPDHLRSMLEDDPDQVNKWSDRVAFFPEPFDQSTIVSCVETHFTRSKK